jgi:hypothetical protein
MAVTEVTTVRAKMILDDGRYIMMRLGGVCVREFE